MNFCLMEIVKILDKLNVCPNDKHTVIIVNSIDNNEKQKLINCINMAITRELNFSYTARSKKGSNLIHIYKIRNNGFYRRDELDKMDITIDYSYIIHNPFKIRINRIYYEDKDRFIKNPNYNPNEWLHS